MRPVIFIGRWYDEIVRVGFIPIDPHLQHVNERKLRAALEFLGKRKVVAA